MFSKKIGLFGATSLVGERLISLLHDCGEQIHAFSRKAQKPGSDGLAWHQLSAIDYRNNDIIEDWLCAAPIWVLPDHFILLESYGVRRIVVLSSTSRFTKTTSSDQTDIATAARLSEGEQRLKTWAASKGIKWIILRPTLIYGHGRDKNIAEIARFIRRFGFFPLLGKANGLRQPIHVEDVAKACVAALKSPAAVNRSYNISGEETLPYHEMVSRVFAASHRSPRMLRIPLAVFSFGVSCMRLLPRYKHWSVAMAERMNNDLVFDHSDAVRDFSFSPRPFQLSAEDLPR
ncbi:NAD-dependent epimerase/dehydratase family protein [Desulfopila sp. IMCC35006]|uniref:NAD-dependent epimerase/dehydratase family protein n=1 Tax=Desulfopila sp. IMCC35006 TaxID=2569542 RepID=UPI0010ABDD30|nr:NAD-dependent epimerase/dehydratase family protein [Desulfopila sp. IMCC35006]TKB26128.1 NAD-dependent epimerase/dehydratase family protein [Desulfopila sp. IMCC35006]